jgi:DNA-binding CsgD family transcriptional regulator
MKIFHPFYMMKKIDGLSPRENEVAHLLLEGRSNKQIALSLEVSERTVEFHLKNIYIKMQVGSRVELILKLVESTVVSENEKVDNGDQPARLRAEQSWRNLVSLIKKEVAMTMKISFEDVENYLRRHTDIFSLVIFLTASLTIRYILFDVGLYFWGSYILLELLLLFAAARLGEMFNGTWRFRPLMAILVAGMLPLLIGGIDQLYLNTILRYTDSISVSLPALCTTAEWLKAADGTLYLSTQSSITSDFVWFAAMAEMLIAFLLSRMLGKRPDKENLVTA